MRLALQAGLLIGQDLPFFMASRMEAFDLAQHLAKWQLLNK